MDPTISLAVGAVAGAALALAARAAIHARRGPTSPAGEERRLDELRRRAEEASREAAGLLEQARDRLAQAGGLSREEAKARALEELDRELAQERARRVEASTAAARDEAQARAREIVGTAIQRVAAHHAAERTLTSVPLPDDGYKGRVIGRDGRNAAAFERATGCDLVVDETPGVVSISGFDPVRREVARRALAALVADGRIQPARIEEVVEATRRGLEAEIAEAGRRALRECEVGEAHPRVVELLGRLQFRTSYGQNVLRHSVEVAHLCGAMAGELGLDPRLARRAGLLHDLGKAVDQETEGGHAAAGGEVARRCGEPAIVVNAIASHHEEVPQESVYAVLAQAADAISASRPGARTDAADRYARRLKDLEAVAAAFPGVQGVFAVQAGREVRVVVDAARVSDDDAVLLSRDIAKAVEGALAYPGEVKVTVLRQTQAVAWAR